MYTSSPSVVEIYRKTTKLCCFSQENPPFSVALKLPRYEPIGLSQLGTMLEKYHKIQPKHRTTDELKVVLQTIWEEMPQEHVNKAAAIFTKYLTACVAVAANGGHSEHLQ